MILALSLLETVLMPRNDVIHRIEVYKVYKEFTKSMYRSKFGDSYTYRCNTVDIVM